MKTFDVDWEGIKNCDISGPTLYKIILDCINFYKKENLKGQQIILIKEKHIVYTSNNFLLNLPYKTDKVILGDKFELRLHHFETEQYIDYILRFYQFCFNKKVTLFEISVYYSKRVSTLNITRNIPNTVDSNLRELSRDIIEYIDYKITPIID